MQPRYESTKEKKSIEQLVKGFDWWMKNTKPHKGTHIEELLKWLWCEFYPINSIKNYSAFCKIASVLASKGYDTNREIPKKDFEVAFSEAERRKKTDEKKGDHMFFSKLPTSIARRGKIVQRADTVALLDAIEGNHWGPRDIYESELVPLNKVFDFKK